MQEYELELEYLHVSNARYSSVQHENETNCTCCEKEATFHIEYIQYLDDTRDVRKSMGYNMKS